MRYMKPSHAQISQQNNLLLDSGFTILESRYTHTLHAAYFNAKTTLNSLRYCSTVLAIPVTGSRDLAGWRPHFNSPSAYLPGTH
jgi:hypothetical protein